MAEENKKKTGFNSDDLAPINVDVKRKSKPNPRTSIPAHKRRTQRPPNLVTR